MFVSLMAMGMLYYHKFHEEPHSPVLRKAKVANDIIAADQTEDFAQTVRILFWCGVPPALLALCGGGGSSENHFSRWRISPRPLRA
jgi:hypothetical protein